jgi:hypothetical protein
MTGTQSERDEQQAHESVMQVIEDAVTAFKRGGMSYDRAASLIGTALAHESARPARIGETHTPKVTT